MKAVRNFILLLLLLLCAGASARAAVADGDSAAGTVDLRGESSVTFSQRTDGSKLVDVYYALDGGTSSVALGVSLDGGTTFSSVKTLTGDVGAAVSAGTAKHIVWNAGTDQPGAAYPNVKMRVTALLDGAGGTFAPIPGGTYQMGNLSGDSDITDAVPVTVTLSPYYMSVNDTTKAQWDAVRTWATANGYTDLAAGAGKASNHPVQTVIWYDAAKWANAASEKEGLTPCYQVAGNVVRTGTSNAVTCDWSANGYRLPTEAEWEVAARGGLSGKRFPWGDTISQSQANYKASASYAYDLSGSVNDYHPTYTTGGMPYTSPAGSFAANGYGLYDMAGNVRQWCWDWYGTPYAGVTDPRGAATGSNRVLRGGFWNWSAIRARGAFRDYYSPSLAYDNFGFRLARGRSSGSGTGTLSAGGLVDTTPPVVSVPAAVSVSATSASGASVTLGGASATDNLGGTPTLTYSPASGSTFPVGTTTVTVTATDSMGNVGTGTFNVTVSAPAAEATGVTFSQRTDGSKLVDVYYTLDGGTSSVALGVSLDGGTTFSSVKTLTGDVGAAISAGTAKHIVWNAGTDQPGAGDPNVKMRVTALLDGAGGTFAPIPGGTYQMGNLIGDSDIADAVPVSVTLSPYYMSVNDTTKAQWDSVRTWASTNGYTDLAAGLGKASNHPVQTVTWYDAVKWANAASQKEGLIPCYKVSGAVYRLGNNNGVTCDWSANGYRLPTEAEWEVAARGGLSGKRFPWGDTISQSQANYKASKVYAYDSSGLVNDFHPTYKTGGMPYTSPVGSFAANGYGLYDMVGNVYQWCWDWYGTPYAGGTDPRGAATGSYRVLHGGYWESQVPRCAWRDFGTAPTSKGTSYGFRLARGRSSGSGSGTLSASGAVDTTPPVVSVPGAVTVDATSGSGASVTLSGASATDNLGGTPTLTYSPASGSTFPVGTTMVTVTATDSMGNVGTGTFNVTVSAPAAEATGVTFSQRTDGSKLVDVYYTLNGGTSSVALGVSLDGGTTFSSVKTLTGDVGAAISAGTEKHIVWNAGTDQPGAGYPNVKMRVTALLDGAGGTFAPIPGGTYQMGNLIGDSDVTDAAPVSITLSPYYISVNDTTKAQWDSVRTWAAANGYTALAAGAGKASNHPVQMLKWDDVVKWVNAASEKEGLTPCYKVSGAVYRTGTSNAVTCDWLANGYRLPTEAEWEVAARGGVGGKRFPWGDTISHGQGNYRASTSYVYDSSGSVNDYLPTYKSGATPYTSPVGSFAANGYGLYDMAGNVWQWCWDWYGTPYAGGADPRGALTGSSRVLRGGGWYNDAHYARVANRDSKAPTLESFNYGFRLARGRPSGSGSGALSGGGVVDTTAPVVTVPGTVTVDATSGSGASVTLSDASATDNLGGTPTLIYSPASGSTFPVGTTTVTVTATDSMGNVGTGTFTVIVRSPPVILTQPVSLTVTAGSSAAFSVVATGGSLGYQWRKGGSAISGGTLATLAIASAQTLDAGSYDVVVTNAGGSRTSNVATLIVNVPPTIVTQPNGATVNPGAGVTFTVVANGTAPLAYQWRKNSVAIAGGTAASYAVAAAQTTDAANYDVVVTNPAGGVTSNTATLSLNAPPVITVHPVGVAANVGAAMAFSVTAEGTAPLMYQWRKGGTDIPGAAGAILAIGAVQPSDVGSYDVVVTNVADKATSAAALLTLNSAPTILTHPVGGAVNPGATVTLNVTASGTAPLQYQWRKNGVALSGATTGTWKISAAQAADAGNYDVVVSNVAGSEKSAVATVELNWGPTILTQPSAFWVNPGAAATFNVVAEGTAPLLYQWRKNGVTIAGGTAASYTVAAAQSTDAGNYDVVVTNVVRHVTSSVAALTLNTAPNITTQPVGGALNPGAAKTLSVTATGTAPLGYQWRLNGSAIAGGTASAYTLSNASETNVGSYDVVVTNVVESVLSNTALVTLNAPPSILAQPDSLAVNPGTAASFSVQAGGTAPLTYQWRKNSVPISGATAGTYSIASAQSTHAANYDVVVSNVVDSVTSAFATLTLNTPVTITAQPVGVAVNPGASALFSVTASGTEPLAYQWSRNGSAIEGATAATYTVVAAQSVDAGSYSVVVSNVVGSVPSNAALLRLNQGPVITLQPSDGAVNPGGSLLFSVAATGTAPLTYQWRKGGLSIAGATAAVYTVLNAQASDAGAYDVVVSNVAGSATSSAATLALNTAVSITSQPVGQSVVLFSGTTFSVTAGGTPPLRYQWQRNGTAITGATAASLSIGSAKIVDAGSYTVEVTNIVGSVFSNTVPLTVLTPVSITTQPVGGAVNPGGSRTLSAVAAGTAPLRYQWQLNGVAIAGATGDSYTIANAQATDAGAYTVEVSNAVGGAASSATSNPAVVTLNTAVTITAQPVGASVASGAPVTLSVVATGTSPLAYQWRKNGVVIAGATGATYTIGAVKAANIGDYDVLVGNVVGSVSSDMVAVALTPPPPAPTPTAVTFTGQLPSMGVNPGVDVTLSVPFTGVGTFTYQWYKNDVPIAGATGATYTISGAQAADAGSYKLVVTNETGPYTSNSAALTLNTPVSILTHPQAATVNPGAPLTLSVVATGTAPLSYKWRKDGVVLAGATSQSYTISSVKASNEGTYDVLVSNVVDGASSDAALVLVNAGPSIVTQPVSGRVNPGGTFSFSVAATGTDPLSYQWLRGGVGIGGATAATLTVGNAQSGDAGNYTVVVSNVVGSEKSTAASLVLNVPVTIVVPPAGLDLNPGASGTLRVSAAGTAPLTYQWSCNGLPIPGATSATYAILAASAADAGAYTVQVTNVVDSVTSAPAQVRLNVKPTISVQPSSASVNLGGTVTLSVVAEGTATLNYQWRFNGSAIAGATKANYTLTNAQAARAGNYDVVVSNVAGDVTSQTATVSLNEGPKIVSQPQGLAVHAGAQAVLSVVATGTAPLRYQWRLDGEAVPGATGAELTLGAVQAADAGRYDVLVTNVVTSVLSSVAQLTLNTPPSILTQPVSVMANPGGAVRFGVVASGTAPLSYQWRKDGSLLVGAQDATFALASVQGGDRGVYDVVVSNVAGSATSTGGTLGLNVPVSITTQPADVTLNPGASGTLTVVATGTAPLRYQWYRNGKAVSGATAATCLLTAVQAADAGLYTVEVANVVDSVPSAAATVSVNAGVTILTQPQGASVAVGSAVSLGVVAAGTAPLGYQWRRNGADLAGATGSTYALAAAQLSDGGVYDVVVGNVVGSVVSAQATLSVVEPPTLTAQPQPLTVLSGQAASFNVTAVGTAPLLYQWRREGEAIAGATASSYTVGSALPVHAGSYEVAVSNSAGTAVSLAALLTVNVPVSILTQPADLSVNLGADAVFTVVAAGTGPLTYQWRKAGVPVAGGTQESLVVPASQFADAGSYDVLVGNVVGSVASEAALLAVRDPQGIIPPPPEVSVAAWESTTLEVAMTGAGPFTYQWLFNGVPIKGATGPSYTIAQATSRSAGVYDVVVGTPSGDLTGGTKVTVTGLVSGQPIVLVHPKNSTVKPYASSSVSATVASEEAFRFQWLLNGVPVGGAGGSGTGSGGAPQTITYGIGTTVDSQQGLYQLVATGGNGVAVESRPGAILLTISFGETRLLLKGWTTELGTFLDDTNQGVDKSTGVQYGFVDLPSNVPKTDTLLVAVNTVGTPSYTWHYRAVNGLITAIPSHVNQPYAKLELSSPDVPKKKGAYVLTIRTTSPVSARAVYFNAMTFVAGTGSAQPGAAPVFVRQPFSLTVPEGGAADFGVELDGLVARYAWWKRDFSGVEGSLPWARSAPWLTMDAAVAGDGGSYWVEALDFFGRSVRSSEAELSIVPAGD